MKYKIITNHIVITYPIDINWQHFLKWLGPQSDVVLPLRRQRQAHSVSQWKNAAESQNVNVFCLKEAQGYLSNHYRIQNVWTRTLPVVGDVIKHLDVT
jgi:hypothetical protein